MGATKIEWCDWTFNPWRGCVKVSPGCANCYAATQSKRNPSTLGVWGPDGKRVVAAESAWREVLKWDKAAMEAGERHRVFCASMADVFEDWQGPMMGSGDVILGKDFRASRGPATRLTMADVRGRLFGLIEQTPHLDWLLLTKRPENVLRMWPHDVDEALDCPPGPEREAFASRLPRRFDNAWLGVSVEDQAHADERIPLLLKIPAAVRFLSCEPLLEAVRLVQRFKDGGTRDYLTGQFHGLQCKGENGHPDFVAETCDPKLPRIDWVIVGGESGTKARPFNIAWARSIVDQCAAAGVACFVKQLGANVEACDVIDAMDYFPGDVRLSPGSTRNDARVHLKSIKGGDLAEWPEALRVRQFPKARVGA